MLRSTLFVLAASLVWAQQQPPQEDAATRIPPPRPFVLAPRIGVSGDKELTLQDALAMALANNKDVDGSRIDREKAVNTVSGARGYFDPRVGGVTSFQKNVTPVASTLGGSATGAVTSRNSLADPQFSGSLPWLGTTYQLDFSSARTTTNNSFTQLNPQYPTSLNFSFTQPLFRNLRYDDNRHRLEVAKKNVSLTDEQFRQRVMQIVTQTEQAYWDLAFAYRNLEVQLDAVRLGGEQDESNRRQQEQGLLAPIDVVAAQRQLATFEVNAYSAQEALTAAENVLKTLILPDRTDPTWSSALIPITPVNVSPPVTPLLDAVREGLANRPELAQIQINSEINATDNKFYREQTKPQVDLVATHTNAGLAGIQLPAGPNPFTAGLTSLSERINDLSLLAGLQPLPSTGGGTGSTLPSLLVGSYGQSVSNVFNNNFPTTQVQLRLSLPLRNRTAEANLNNSLAEARRIRNQRQQTEQSIEASVRNAMQSVESAKSRLGSARVARQSAEEQYQSEQRQFRAGTSTLFLVQQRQTDMITARSQERRAESDLGKAIATFE
ncbi:MAG TPA: TolC family protein, partial [Bryobacteraceae bacterium]|nr:TolC family protein [Bryobacteraceae bacterium]